MNQKSIAYQRLAPLEKLTFAVIQQATRDAKDRKIEPAMREDAQRFLLDCGLSDLLPNGASRRR